MSGSFKIGDVCVVVRVENPLAMHIFGTECAIETIDTVYHAPDVYGCRCVDGKIWWAHHSCLRKKPGHDDVNTVVDWRSCIWKPPHLRETKRGPTVVLG